MIAGANRMQAAPAVEPLFRYGAAGNIVPWLASGYKENAAEKTITITLNKGIKFHDGTDLNAEAVKWNFEEYKTAKMAGTEMFKSVDIIDDYNIRITLTQWDNTVLSNLPFFGLMISPTAFKKNGRDWATNNAVGTGPFQLISFARDSKTVYKKFDGYWQKGKPYVDQIDWTPIANGVTRFMSLKSGEVDIALYLDSKDRPELEKSGFKIASEKVASPMSMVPDSVHPESPWANVKVRQAAQHAIDSQAIVEKILLGQGEAPNQLMFKGHWSYNPDIVGYPYNPAKAKQLLAEAGYPTGFKTTIYNLIDNDFNPIYEAVQSYFKAVGIDATLEPIQVARWMELAVRGGNWNGLMHMGAISNLDTTAQLSTRFMGANYYSKMAVPEDYAKAVKDALAAPDFDTKQKLTKQALKIFVDKYCNIIFINFQFRYYANAKYVNNSGFGTTVIYWNPEEVWLSR
jgi:ABC-type transport system substrate-binding protein